MKLSCKTCGSDVRQINGQLVRACEHADAPVVANMIGHAFGRAYSNPEEKLDHGIQERQGHRRQPA